MSLLSRKTAGIGRVLSLGALVLLPPLVACSGESDALVQEDVSGSASPNINLDPSLKLEGCNDTPDGGAEAPDAGTEVPDAGMAEPKPDPCASGTIEPGPNPVRRLTRQEYNNTVRDLLGDTRNLASSFAPEEEGLGFNNNALALSVTQLHIEQYLDAAEKLAAAANLTQVVPCDPASIGADACGKQFIESFGRRAFRRPLDSGEVTRMKALFDDARASFDFNTAVRMVIQAMLQSPQFLYRPEVGTPGNPNQVVPLTQYEIASRLSYLLWQSMPDATLFTAAANGKLGTPAEIEAQARRMLQDPRARPAMFDFYRQWLQLSHLDYTTKDTAMFPDFATLKPLMKKESEAFLNYVFWEGGGKADLLFNAPYTFVNKTLAAHYGVSGVTTESFTKVSLDPTKRAGIFTQGAFLSALAKPNQTSPVHRGKFVREQLFCQSLPPPPDGLVIIPPDPKPGTSTRDRFAEHANNQACVGCHQLMDPIGFGFENYDAVGAYRTVDNGLPVDASGEVVGAGDANGTFVGAIALTQKLGQSTTVKECLATQWFRFGYGRSESNADACSVHQIQTAFANSGYDMQELVVALTQSDAFRYRRIPVPIAELKPTAVTSSADENSTNVAANVADKNLGTRWAAYGDGQWVRYDLGAKKLVAYARIAWPYGNERNDRFEIQVSDDGTTWKSVFNGQSDGTTTLHQVHDFADTEARYVRVLGHGNTKAGVELWNSISELELYGQ